MAGAPNYLPSASIETLRQRAEILKRVRQFFDDRGFFEVQTPVLSRDTVVDRFIEPIAVDVPIGETVERFWLQTSPEFCMKRLLVGGAEAIYQVGPAFRAGEIGDLHQLEFTMLEWYRVGDDYQQGMNLLDEFAQAILGCPPARRITYRELFLECAGIDPFDLEGNETFEKWRFVTNRDDRETEFLNLTLVKSVEPKLKTMGSVIVYDWPAEQAALAKLRRDGEISFAERFELYLDGIELANGYHELTDPDVLLNRNETTNRLRQADGRKPLPVQSRLIEAMNAGLPFCCGVALGIDRLVMFATGNKEVAQAMSFNTERA